MSRDYKVPFYSNTPDDTHCFQAVLRMIIKYFQPDSDLTWEALDKMTSKPKGKWTWPMSGLIWLKSNGYDVIDVENFNYAEFINLGKTYLEKIYGSEVATAQELNSDIKRAQQESTDYCRVVNPENRVAKYSEIIEALDQGYLVTCHVNSRTLNGKQGYV